MENIHITVSKTQRGTPWDKTCIDEFDIETDHDNAYKAVAQEIIKLDPSLYANGLYVRAVNENDEVEAYLLVPTEEDGKKSFFVRNAYGNDGWYGYDNGKEEMRYLVCLDEDTNDYKSYTMMFSKQYAKKTERSRKTAMFDTILWQCCGYEDVWSDDISLWIEDNMDNLSSREISELILLNIRFENLS